MPDRVVGMGGEETHTHVKKVSEMPVGQGENIKLGDWKMGRCSGGPFSRVKGLPSEYFFQPGF